MKKRTVTKALAFIFAVLMLISMLPVMNTSAAWTQDATTLYFDASNWSNVRTLYLLIGHDSWSSAFKLTKQAGNNIYVGSVPLWEGVTEWYVINADAGWGNEVSSPSARAQWAYNASSKYTEPINSDLLYSVYGTKVKEFNLAAYSTYRNDSTEEYKTGNNGGVVSASGRDFLGTSVNDETSDAKVAAEIAVANGDSVTYVATAKAGFNFAG